MESKLSGTELKVWLHHAFIEDMPMRLSEKVYATVSLIPRGKVATYADIARAVGRARAWRAVGNILNKNRSSSVPCHRVVRFDGFVGGFGFPGDTTEKERRLLKEGIAIREGRIHLETFRISSFRSLLKDSGEK